VLKPVIPGFIPVIPGLFLFCQEKRGLRRWESLFEQRGKEENGEKREKRRRKEENKLLRNVRNRRELKGSLRIVALLRCYFRESGCAIRACGGYHRGRKRSTLRNIVTLMSETGARSRGRGNNCPTVKREEGGRAG